MVQASFVSLNPFLDEPMSLKPLGRIAWSAGKQEVSKISCSVAVAIGAETTRVYGRAKKTALVIKSETLIVTSWAAGVAVIDRIGLCPDKLAEEERSKFL